MSDAAPSAFRAPEPAGSALHRVRVLVSGLVQGVWFRESTREKAEALGVRGWVRNRVDGTVEGTFEGPKRAVESLVAWCRTGPSGARVDGVEVEVQTPTGGFRDFRVQR